MSQEHNTGSVFAHDLSRIHSKSPNIFDGLLPKLLLQFLASGRCDETILPIFERSICWEPLQYWPQLATGRLTVASPFHEEKHHVTRAQRPRQGAQLSSQLAQQTGQMPNAQRAT